MFTPQFNFRVSKRGNGAENAVAAFQFFQEMMEYLEYCHRRGAQVTVWCFDQSRLDWYAAWPLSRSENDLTDESL